MVFHSGLIKYYFIRSCFMLLCLSGSLIADVVSVSPDKVDFGNVPLGLSKIFQVGLYNGTHKPLSISSTNVTNTATGDFTLLYNACPATLGAGQACTIGVFFSPTQLGAETGVLAVFDDATNSPQKVKLSGVGIAPSLVSIRVNPEFAATLPGQTQQFNATGNYSNGSSQDLTGSVAWTVSVPSVATISGTGLATAIAPGSTTVLASFAGTVGYGYFDVAHYLVTGSMNTGRAEHTATTLNDGKVLVMGGFSEFQALPVPEVYDPATGTFSLTGSASTDRSLHTATLLQNGLVLVTGGASLQAVLSSAEIYDPSTGSFHLTGSMSTPRYRHTATLLEDGRVLIAGGHSGVDFLPSAEIYDPATGFFTTVGSMAQARELHTATLLPNGQVLMAGGHCFCGTVSVTATAELFDPLTQTFTGTGNLLTQRNGHSAVVLPNGKVLVAAGASNLPPLYLAAVGEIYDPATGLFTSTGAMVTPRTQQTTTALANGKVFIVGGNGNAVNLATGELYDSTSGQFTAVSGSMSRTREFAASALLLSGDVLITGGFDGQIYTPTAELYAPGN